MPYFPSNRPLPIAAQDEAFLWQLEVRSEGSQNMRGTPGTGNRIQLVHNPAEQANSRQRSADTTTIDSVRFNISRLSEGFEGYVLRSERRRLGAPLEGTTRVDGEAGGPVDIEAAERDRLVQLTQTIHDALTNLQSRPTGAVGNPRNMSAADRPEWVQSIRRAARESLQSALP